MEQEFLSNSLDKNFGIADEGKASIMAMPRSLKQLKKGQRVYSAGDDASMVNCVVSGWLTSVGEFSDGSRQLLNFHVPIDFVGLEFLSQSQAMSSLIAFEDTTLIQLPVNDFISVLQGSEKAALAILGVVGKKYLALQGRISVFARGSALEKVAYLLLGLRAKQLRNDFKDPNALKLPLTQHDIADALGLTNVTVSRAFSRLTKEGLVEYKLNQIIIKDPERLRNCVLFLENHGVSIDEFG